MLKLATGEAVAKVLKMKNISKYKMAQQIGVSPIMISNYLSGSKMRQKIADTFETYYGIEISDVFTGR